MSNKSKGGKARAASLSPSKRSAIAKKAAAARWDNSYPVATHEGQVKIGDMTIPCYVLADETRVLSERGLLRALGMRAGARDTKEKMPRYLRGKNILEFIEPELKEKLSQPTWFKFKSGLAGKGVSASLLPDICDVWLKARDAGILVGKQADTAKMADILIRGLAHVGIIALVDEATGYQDARARDALEKILQDFISKELHKWVKTFPDDFYKEMFRLRNWKYDPTSIKRPGVIGRYTNDLVYERLAPAVLDELKRLNPKDERGRRKNKHHQHLSREVGHPALREHLASITNFMKASDDWKTLKKLVDRALPKYNETISMILD